MSLTAKDLTLDDQTRLVIDDELKKCKDSCARFIRKWAWIEDKDEAGTPSGIAIKFILWPLQLMALAAILSNRLLVILKARQLGVTWLALAYVVWRLIFNPGYTVVALSKKETPDAKELVRRVTFILTHLPKWMVRSKKKESYFSGPMWESTTLTVTIYHPGQDPSVFTSLTAAPDSGRSFTTNLVILDEWAFQQWASDIFDSAYPTINRPNGGQVIGLSTNKRGSFFEGICKAFKDFGFQRIFLPWWADPRRTKEWYEASKKALPHSYRQEYPATPEEAMSAGEGTAFPEFSEMIHVCRPFKIPAWWRRWRGNDPGYTDPFYWCSIAVSDQGKIYIYREYTRSEKEERVAYSEQARRFSEMCVQGSEAGNPDTDEQGKPIPEKFGFTVAGRDAWNRDRVNGVSSGKSIVDYYGDGGIKDCIEPPRDTLTDRILRKAVWHEYLKPYFDENTHKTTAKLQIFATCTTLIEALPGLVVDEKFHEKVSKEPHVYTNPYDGAGYGLVAWHVRQSRAPEPEKNTIQKDKEKLARTRRMRRVRI